MNQKGYFVMSLFHRGHMIVIFLLQLLLDRGFYQVSKMWHICFVFSYLSLLIMENIGSVCCLFCFPPAIILYWCWLCGPEKGGYVWIKSKEICHCGKDGKLLLTQNSEHVIRRYCGSLYLLCLIL